MAGYSIKNSILKIPEKFYSQSAFIILMLYIISLPISMLYVAFFWDNLIGFFIVTCGTLAQLLVGLYLISRYVRGEFTSIKSIVNLQIWDLLLVVLLLWCTISAFLADDYELAFMGTGYRAEGLTTYFSYAATYICAKLVKDTKQRKLILISFCISISLLAITVYLQTNPNLLFSLGVIGENLAGNGINIAKRSAIFLNRNHFAYMLTLCSLGLAGFSLYTTGVSYIITLALFIFNFWALIKNNTFGCYLSVLAGLLFLAIISYFLNSNRLKKAFMLLLLFGALTVASEFKEVGTISKDFDTMIDDVADPSQSNRPGSGRFTLWNKAINCIMERPVFGYGPEGLHYIYINGGYKNERPHNEYLQMAAFHGIPALCIYIGSLLSLFIYCIQSLKKLPNELIIIGGMIFAYCASAFLGNSMYYTTPYFYLLLGILSTCKHFIYPTN